MDRLYSLDFYTKPNGTYREAFHIGLFRTADEAQKIQRHYQTSIPGFRDFPCTADITQVPIIGNAAEATHVYRYTGWNENESFDEVDILESACFIDRARAEAALTEAQKAFQRQEWALNRYSIGQCGWQEGFTRCVD